MIAYFMDTPNGKTVCVSEVISYDIPIESQPGETGSLTVKKTGVDLSYRYVRIGDHLFVITGKSDETDGADTLAVAPVLASICDNATSGVYYTNSSSDPGLTFRKIIDNSGYEMTRIVSTVYLNRGSISIRHDSDTDKQFIQRLIDLGLTLQDLGISRLAYTHEYDAYYHYYIGSSKTLIDKLGEHFMLSVKRMADGNFVIFAEDYVAQTPVPVYFDDGHAKLVSESYDSDVASLIEFMSSYSTTDLTKLVFPTMYAELRENGSIAVALQRSSGQIGGRSITTKVSYDLRLNEDRIRSEAGAVFAENTYSHKIEFYSDKEYRLGQAVKLFLERGILDTAISKVSLTSDDDRFHYVCGELPELVSEKIRAQNWKYCRRLPLVPKKGELVLI